MAKFLFLAGAISTFVSGTLFVCVTLFKHPLLESLPHMLIALTAVAVHLVAERTLPKYSDIIRDARQLLYWFMGRK